MPQLLLAAQVLDAADQPGLDPLRRRPLLALRQPFRRRIERASFWPDRQFSTDSVDKVRRAAKRALLTEFISWRGFFLEPRFAIRPLAKRFLHEGPNGLGRRLFQHYRPLPDGWRFGKKGGSCDAFQRLIPTGCGLASGPVTDAMKQACLRQATASATSCDPECLKPPIARLCCKDIRRTTLRDHMLWPKYPPSHPA
jgi:hypothetical protein